MDIHNFIRILRGNFDNVPKEKSKSVRIFLSSTFSDTHTERDYLIEFIYPRLKTYCKQTYGLDFQVLDMRWGISNEITNTHMTTTICLNEIKNCQKYSVGPNFIALLSHRYGARALPTRIIAKEYEILRDEMQSSPPEDYELVFEYTKAAGERPDEEPDDKPFHIQIDNLFEHCYELDENEMPARYKLKNMDKIFTDFNHKMPIYGKVWSKIEIRVGDLMRKAAERCYYKSKFNKTQYERFFVSVTEKEIFNGILSKGKNLANNVLYFQRDIEGLEESLNSESPNLTVIKKFADLDSNRQIDQSAKQLLDKLKKKIEPLLPENNIKRFKVKWDPTDGISIKTHKDYVVEFGEIFYEKVKELIDRNQAQESKFERLKYYDVELLQEVLHHAYFCNETVAHFHGRQDILNQIKSYVLSNKETPLVIYGASGCGKTAIMAKCTSQILKFVPDPENYSVILRFLGTTPQTSNTTQLFNSLFYQICRIYNIHLPERYYDTAAEIKNYLITLLTFVSLEYPNKKLVIVLDSVDQLSASDYNLAWVLFSFPSNIKMIYSTIPDHGDLLKTFKSDPDMTDDCFIEIKSLEAKMSIEILKDWLKKESRRLSEPQWNELSLMFESAEKSRSLFPLYVKIVFDIVSKWPSFYEPEKNFKICHNIDQMIEYLFKSLEFLHGKMLFSRTIIYMSMFKNGISENELEDILSLDNEVLYEVFEFHAPPSIRLPVALWSRIKHDLKGYLIEKDIDGSRLVYWYHRRFIEVANSYYISFMRAEVRDEVVKNVIEFYNETWRDKAKPIKFNDYVETKKKNNMFRELVAGSGGTDCRNTSVQPTVFVDKNTGSVKFNQRKIKELPHFLGTLTLSMAVPLVCDNVYFNYQFLHGLFHHTDFVEIMLNVFKYIDNQSPFKFRSQESIEFEQSLSALRLIALIIVNVGSIMTDRSKSAVYQVLARSIAYYKYVPKFTKLIDEYDRESVINSSLLIAHKHLDQEVRQVMIQFEKHLSPITHACLGGTENKTFLFSLSNKLQILRFHGFTHFGEVYFDSNLKFENMLVYFLNDSTYEDLNNNLIANIKGGFLLATKNEIRLHSFQTNYTKPYKVIRTDDTITDMYLITPNHLFVLTKNMDQDSLAVIYNIHSGDVVKTVELSSNRVRMVISNVNKKKITSFNELIKKPVYLVFSYEDTDYTDIYTIQIDEMTRIDMLVNKANDGVELKKSYSVAPLGKMPSFGLSSMMFSNEEDIFKTGNTLYMVLNNGGLVLLQLKFQNKDTESSSSSCVTNITYFKAPSLKYDKNAEYKLLECKKASCLVLDKNTGRVFFYSVDHLHLYQVDLPTSGEKFQSAFFIREHKIAAVSTDGIIHIFLIFTLSDTTTNNTKQPQRKIKSAGGKVEYDKKHFYVLKLMDWRNHYDRLSSHFMQSDKLVTTSYDCTVRIFEVSNCLNFFHSSSVTKRIKSNHEIVQLKDLDYENKLVLAQLKDSNELDVWDIALGEIVESIKLASNDPVEHVFVSNRRIFILSRDRVKESISLRGLSYRVSKLDKTDSFSSREEFNVCIDKVKDYRIYEQRVEDEDHEESWKNSNYLLVIDSSTDCTELDFYHLKYGKLAQKSYRLSKKSARIESLIQRQSSILEHACLTELNSHLILFINTSLFMIDTTTGSILAQTDLAIEEIKLDYFLSPTNLNSNRLTHLTPISNSNDLLGLSNLNQLVYIEYKSGRVSRFYTDTTTQFTSFKIYQHNMLIALNSNDKKFIFYDLNMIRRRRTFSDKKCKLFELELESDSFIQNHYGLTPDSTYFYVIENNKLLRCYKIYHSEHRIRLVSDIFLHCMTKNVFVNTEFISLAMSDRKVITFLIGDPDDSERTFERVQKLPSRNPEVDEKTKEDFEKYLAVMKDDDTENYTEQVDDKILKDYLLREFQTEQEENEMLVGRKVVQTSKRFLFYKNLKKETPKRFSWRIPSYEVDPVKLAKKLEAKKNESVECKKLVAVNNEADYDTFRQELMIQRQKTTDFKTLNTGISVPVVNSYKNVSRACTIQ